MPSENELLLGIEIGGSKLQLVAAKSPGSMVRRQRIAVEPGDCALDIRRRIATALQAWEGIRWLAAGVGFGGPVDWKHGRIHCSHQVAGWDKMDICGWLSDQIAAPVAIENDANVAALAEVCHGAGAGYSPVFYTNSGSGVGGGLVIDGKIYHGAVPGEAELGHMRLTPSGATVEESCSGWAVDRKVREHCARNPSGILARLVAQAPGREARHLKEALLAGDAAAKDILDDTASALAFVLSHVVHLIHPELVLLGGGLSLIGEPWRESVAQALPQHLMEVFLPGPEIRLAALGEDIVPIGALLLAASITNRNSSSQFTNLFNQKCKS
jgi:glucokinase